MSKEQASATSVAIPLPKGKKLAVQIGCICMMLSVAMLGLSLSVLQGPILTKMNAMNYFSLLTIFASLGLSIMTPIGGKLGDLFGRRRIVIVSGIIATVCGLGLGIVKSVVPFMILRLILGAAQGAYTAAPYIIAREINEAKDVPKAMGLLSSSIAIGGFVGSIIAGALTDMGYLNLAIMFPVIPLIIGVVLIGLNMPNKVRQDKVSIDFPGIIALAIVLTSFLLAMNYGGKIGWTNPYILGGFVIAVISIYCLIKIEKKAAEPIIPVQLFSSKPYTTLLLVGFIAYFYQNTMNVYAPLAVQEVLNASTTASGALQLPRTIVTMILPAFAGIWVAKKKDNSWKAMAIAMIMVILCFMPLSFTTSTTSIAIYIGAITLTGIAESFRAVSITPAAQGTLSPKNLGIGTALVTFVNSLATLFSAAISGVIFDANADSINTAINSIYITTTVITIIGLLVVLILVRKNTRNNAKESSIGV
ncbi:MFS transporter [Alloiococcus sp. CFN-8]|uniref:MFS transporter n=1 Tax=Alloiococcus sp. CFN-8 TaxID=3416081 RepID=UPI003CE94A91